MGPRKSVNDAKDAAGSEPEPSTKPESTSEAEPSTSQSARSNARVITGLLFHCAAMVFVPWLLFGLISYGHLDPVLNRLFGPVDKNSKNTLAAILAVLAVNVVVGNFIFRAFREDEADQKAKHSKKKD